MSSSEVIPLASLVDASSRISRQTFRGKTFVGPAVIALIDNVTIEGCTWEAPNPESLMIEVPDGKLLVGIIGLSQVTFEFCTFRNVALIGTKEQIDLLRNALGLVVPPQVVEAG